MFEIGSFVMYKRDVCKIVSIEKNKYTALDCYILVPVIDESLRISAPLDNKNGYLRNLLTKEEIDDLIKSISLIEPLKIDSKNLENEYRALLHSGKHEDLIKIIKTTYLRNKERQKNKRSIGEKDKEYFNKAEKYLYSEIAIVLDKTFDEAKEYVIDVVKEMEK